METNLKESISTLKLDIKRRVAANREYRALARKYKYKYTTWLDVSDKFLAENCIGHKYTHNIRWLYDSNTESKILRYMYIAYGILRGRNLYEIEPTVRENNNPKWDTVHTYIEKYVGKEYKDMSFLTELFNHKKKPEPKKPALKMYVLVRTDIAPINRAVQAGHAVAEYMKHHSCATSWDNGIMVYLGVSDDDAINLWEARLQANNIKYSTFVEPDWKVKPEPLKTALACCTTGELLADLPLLSMDPYMGTPVDQVITDRQVCG